VAAAYRPSPAEPSEALPAEQAVVAAWLVRELEVVVAQPEEMVAPAEAVALPAEQAVVVAP
jgi:hypothetical protein